jgi:hypothetical protein
MAATSSRRSRVVLDTVAEEEVDGTLVEGKPPPGEGVVAAQNSALVGS